MGVVRSRNSTPDCFKYEKCASAPTGSTPPRFGNQPLMFASYTRSQFSRQSSSRVMSGLNRDTRNRECIRPMLRSHRHNRREAESVDSLSALAAWELTSRLIVIRNQSAQATSLSNRRRAARTMIAFRTSASVSVKMGHPPRSSARTCSRTNGSTPDSPDAA